MLEAAIEIFRWREVAYRKSNGNNHIIASLSKSGGMRRI